MLALYFFLFTFLGLSLLFIALGFPFFLTIFITITLVGSIFLLLTGNFLEAIIYFIVWSCALAIYEDGRRMDVRFKFLFALIALIFPIIGVPLYWMLRKKMSRIIGETIKSEGGSITFINR